jgi:PPOX class probable F420-dependent enzyme
MGFAALRDHKYISLETFKKSGEGVKTPVWFAADPSVDLSGDGALLYIYTIGNMGKVKRIRNNGHVKIAPCTIKGVPLGEPVDARAEIVTGEVASKAMRLLNKKYFPWKQLLGLFALFSRRERVVMAIHPA